MCINSKSKIYNLKKEYFNPKIINLSGKVLELGFGKGENFKFYSRDCDVTAIDLKISFNEKRSNIKMTKYEVYDKLPFEDETFDYIIFSFFMCSIRNQQSIINEYNRILKLNGQIISLEHIKSANKFYKILQKLISPITIVFFKNCNFFNIFSESMKRHFYMEKHIYIPNYIEPYEFAIWNKHST